MTPIVNIKGQDYATLAGGEPVYRVVDRQGNAYTVDISLPVTDPEILRLYRARVSLTPAEMNRF